MAETEDKRLPKPVDYDQLFPGRFLKAGLFKGRNVTLTISDVDLEKLPQDNGKERARGILSFKEREMQLVLNHTNGVCIKAMFGRKPMEWIGKRITLCPEKDKFGREVVDAIRVHGSPDLEESIDVEIRMPRKKPKMRTLHATGKSSVAAPDDPGPGPDDDYEPGSDR